MYFIFLERWCVLIKILTSFLLALMFTFAIQLSEPLATNSYRFSSVPGSDLVYMVNKSNPISRDYVPSNLVEISGYIPSTREIYLREEALLALLTMYNDILANGLDMVAVSGYRDYDYQSSLNEAEIKKQKSIYSDENQAISVANAVVTPPGTSEHQLGLAIDVSDNGTLTEAFGDTDVGKWLDKYANRYGFILRYEKDKTDITGITYEPWHFRYVGQVHAEYMYQKDLSFEEYMKRLKTKKMITVTLHNNLNYSVVYSKTDNVSSQNLIDISSDNDGGFIITRSLY